MTWGTVFSGFKDNDWRLEPHENKTSYCIAKETIECTGSPQNSLSDSPSTILTLSGLARVVQFLGWISLVIFQNQAHAIFTPPGLDLDVRREPFRLPPPAPTHTQLWLPWLLFWFLLGRAPPESSPLVLSPQPHIGFQSGNAAPTLAQLEAS